MEKSMYHKLYDKKMAITVQTTLDTFFSEKEHTLILLNYSVLRKYWFYPFSLPCIIRTVIEFIMF